MRSISFTIPLLFGALLLPLTASAHARQVFEINGTQYQFTAGSLNEPIAVDDKTAVDLRVSRLPSGAPVEGLESTLQVELIAGAAKKTLDLAAVYGTPGAYKAPFYPTVATTITYRFFGTIADTPIDISFSCSPAGHATAEEDTERTEVSAGVIRILKTGSFGCPAEKASMGFPEVSASVVEMNQQVGNARAWAMSGAGLGVVSLVLAGYAVIARRRG